MLKYPDSRTPYLQDSRYTSEVYSRIEQGTTVLSHRPEPLLKGYKRADVEMYVLNYRGLDTDVNDMTWGSSTKVRLDMSCYNMKLGLYLAWWSLQNTDIHRGVSLIGQTQVLIPWVTTPQRDLYRTLINGSPYENENCGGSMNPCFPLSSLDGHHHTTGTIRFHLSMATIEKNQSIIWIPAAWHSREYMATIALTILCLAPFPIGNLGINLQARDTISIQW